MKTLLTCEVDSPIGRIALFADGKALVGLEFADRRTRVNELRGHLERAFGALELQESPDPAGAATRLERFFTGDLTALAEQQVLAFGTAFEKKVWRELCAIPPGEVRSYGEVARAIGKPTATRAVGAANGRNPVALFVPCHRVIASDGTLHGYGGGLHRKRWLLDHERQHAATRAERGQLDLALRR
jgi:methylated-DNA-[protein]-cysteine S-methyltransferase